MKWIVLFSFLQQSYLVYCLSCLPGWTSRPGDASCYLLVDQQRAKTWGDAQSACMAMKGSLVQVNSTGQWTFLQSEMAKRIQSGGGTTDWWTGAKMSGGSWVWTDGSTLNSGLGLWASNQPNTAIHPGCVEASQSNSGIALMVTSCTMEKGYICERSLTMTAYCDTDSGWESQNGNCYKFFDYRKQWVDAKFDCENNGAVLAKPMSDQEQRTVYDLAVHYKRDTWIGLHAVPQSGNVVWQWSNGSTVTGKSYWKTNPPSITGLANNTCVIEHLGNKPLTGWTTKACDVELQYICQKPEGNCAPGWKAFGAMCYQFDPRFLINWQSTKTYCEKQGGAMLEITTADIQTFVNSYLNELRAAGLSYFWLGSTGKSGIYTWNSGSPLSYTNWATRPSTSHYQRCAYITTSSSRGQWTVTSYCTQSRGVACQIPSSSMVLPVTTPSPRYVCERGWRNVNYRTSDQCYYFNTTSLVSWADAQKGCQDVQGHLGTITDALVQSYLSTRYVCERGWMNVNYRTSDQCYKFNTTSLVSWADAQKGCQDVQGHLGIITDTSVQSYLSRYLRAPMWIGLSDQAVEGTFTWIDNSATSYTNWYGHDVTKINTDGKDCVQMLYSGVRGAWKASECDEISGFLCQKKALNAQTTPGTGISTTAIPWSVNCGPFWEELSSSGACFQFHDEQKSYTDAQAFCSQNGGNLASIVSIGEQNYVAGRIAGMHSLSLWLGGNDLNAEGGWAWQDSSPLTYINWNTGEPNNADDNEDCVTIYTAKATWSDVNCNLKNGFICKKQSRVTPKPISTVPTQSVPAGMLLGCPGGWMSYNGQCYQINRDSQTWTKAQSVCRQADGDLTSITSLGEQDFLYSQARSASGPLWIGFNSLRKNRFYEWSDGQRTTFTHWSRDEPNNALGGNEQCVTFNGLGAGYWSDTACNLPSVVGYICKKSPAIVSATTQQDYKKGCPANGVGYYSNCYLFMETKMTFTAAENYCVQQGGHLMTVTDRFIQAFLTSELVQHTGMYWIGLKTYLTGRYYYYWNDKTRVRFTNFDQAHSGLEIASCLAVNTARPAGLWHNSKCTELRPFICQTSRTGFTLPPPGQQTTLSNRCPRYYTDYSGQCYRLMSTSYYYRKTWTAARDYCRMYGGDLASVHNSSEAEGLKKYIFRYTRGQYWIGLNNIASKGYSWSDGSGFTYSKWGQGQPDNHNKQENCVEWDMATNSFRDSNCFVTKTYACQVKKGSVAVPPTTARPSVTKPPVKCGTTSRYARYWKYFNGSCYFFGYQVKSYFDSRDYCHSIKGELVSLHSIDEANFFNSMLGTTSGNSAWLGLNELDIQKGYKWSDGTPVNFLNWDKNEPNDGFGGQKCTIISNLNGFWADENCGQLYRYICKQPVGNQPAVTPSPAPALPGNCRSGWTNLGNKCYLKVDGYLNFNDSNKACKRYGKGFSLASINNADEQSLVLSLMNGKTNNYWIGLNQMHSLRQFVWVDNSRVFFTNWDYREPNGSSYYPTRQELCVEFRTYDTSAGRWADVNCLFKRGYVCQGYKEASKPVPTVPALPSWCKGTGYQVYGQSCYKVDATLRTWDDSVAFCKPGGGHLVSIGDQFEQAHIRVMTYGMDPFFWTGMTDKKLKGVYRWSDSWPVLYTNWGYGEPSRMDGEGCVAMVANGAWNDTMCSNKYGAICEISHGTPPPHPSEVAGYCKNSSWTQHDKYCYYVSPRSYASWPEANFYCHKIGMRLVTVHSAEDQTFLLKQIMKQKYLSRYYFWVGLTAGSSGFEWVDEFAVSFTNWAPNEPSNGKSRNPEECIQMHPTSGLWYDTTCTTRRPYICMADMVFPAQPGQSTMAPKPGQSTMAPKTSGPGHITKSPGQQTDTKPPNNTPGKGHSQPVTARGVNTQHPPSGPTSTSAQQRQHGNKPKSGGMSGGAVAGVIISVLLILGGVGLGLIFARRRGLINFGPNIFPSGSFENALYKKSADDVDIQ